MYRITLKILDMHILMCGFIHIPTGYFYQEKNLKIRSPFSYLSGSYRYGGCLVESDGYVYGGGVGVEGSCGNKKTPSTLLHVLGVIYMKREEMML